MTHIKLLSMAVLMLGAAELSHAASTTINFDGIANGTVINNFYSGVTFNNPVIDASQGLNGDIYARASSSAASGENVVSVFGSGFPAFDARWGAVEAVFNTAQNFVSIDAAILRVSEGFDAPINAPKLEVYGANGFLGAVLWDFALIPQPDVGEITGYQTLSFTAAGNEITKIRFLSGQPGGAPSNFGLFDNLTFGTNDTGNGNGNGTVPEPSSLALMFFGLSGLCLRKRANQFRS